MARSTNQKGGLTRVDMMPRGSQAPFGAEPSVLIALLDKECRWQATESGVTGHLYTRHDRLVDPGGWNYNF